MVGEEEFVLVEVYFGDEDVEEMSALLGIFSSEGTK